MESKIEVKSMRECRDELVLKAPEDIVTQFELYVKNDKKVPAIMLLRNYGIIF